jgi:hypothetical protein
VTRLVLAVLVVTAVRAAAANSSGEPMSAFAANVGTQTGDEAAVTLYVVPEGQTLLVTDVLVANHGQENGPLYLADSRHTRCSIELLQNTLINNGPGVLSALANVHTRFETGIPFEAGEPVIATLARGTRGVDVTITGRLVRAARARAPIRLPGGARDREDNTRRGPEPE